MQKPKRSSLTAFIGNKQPELDPHRVGDTSSISFGLLYSIKKGFSWRCMLPRIENCYRRCWMVEPKSGASSCLSLAGESGSTDFGVDVGSVGSASECRNLPGGLVWDTEVIQATQDDQIRCWAEPGLLSVLSAGDLHSIQGSSRSWVDKVRPHYTSKTCHVCGAMNEGKNMPMPVLDVGTRRS